MAEELGEKTELPTERRLSDVRDRGQVAKSPSLSAAIELIGAFILIIAFGASLVAGLAAAIRITFQELSAPGSLDAGNLAGALAISAARGAWMLLPLLILAFVIAAIAQLVQVGLLFTAKPLRPNLGKLNPIQGVSRLFARRNLVRSGVDSVKLAAVILITWLVIRSGFEVIAGSPLLTPLQWGAMLGGLVFELMMWLLALLLVVGILDYAYQKWQHVQDNRMTKFEVKEERRSMDGDPEIKARRLRMAREIVLQRIRQAVPKADVVVTNPTHFSVALKYDEKTMHAPRVIAKGADFVAFRIREVARASGVTIVERPPLARALYEAVPVGRTINPEHYEAVAEILAYVYRLKSGTAGAA